MKPTHDSLLRVTFRALASLSAALWVTAPPHSFAQAEPVSLDTMIVEGEAEQISQAYTALKSGTALLDTPASVSLATEALLDAQGAVSLQDAIRNLSGLGQAGNNYGIGDQLVIRGQEISYTYDGLDAGSGGSGGGSGATVRSLTNVERVEVLKGPAGTLYGIGGAGGIVNLVEKRPQPVAHDRLRAYVGTWETYGAEYDFNRPLNERWSFRFIASTRQSEGYRNFNEDRTEFYPSLRFDANADHTLLFTGAYIADRVQVDSIGHPVRIFDESSTGVPAAEATVADIPNGPTGGGRVQLTPDQQQQLIDSLAPGDGTQPFDLGNVSLISPLARPTDGEEFRFKVRHDWSIGADTAFAQYAQFRSYGSDYVRQTGAYNYVYWNRNGSINAAPRAPLVENGVLYPYAARRQEYRKVDFQEDTLQYFAELKHRISRGEVTHDLLATSYLEWRDYETQNWSVYDADNSRSAANPVPYIYDIRSPNWPTGRFEDYEQYPSSDYTKDVTSIGAGLQDVITLPHDLTARFAVGYNRIKQDYDNNLQRSGDPLPVASSDEGLNYNAGLSWRVRPQTSVFVTAAQGRTAYSVTGSVSLNNPPDSESENFEIGLRHQMLDGRLLFSTALFATSRTHLRYGNPLYDDDPGSPTYNIEVDPYRYDGYEETRGAELDLNVNLTDRWMINANATYQDPRTRRDPGTGTVTGLQKGLPRVFGSVWAQHVLATEFAGGRVTLGGGVTHTGRRSINSTSFGIAQAYVDAFTTIDAIVRYDNPDHWNVQLNLNNVTDEAYYDLAQFLGGRPGEPFNATVTFTAEF
ncbi:TonB-dependent receptor [Actomonas aquatica]|uniref:TonB-dependent receptor n=1 Tax=Actomonas aquatica TaxID=2866162 RepID=A0ABZ1C5Z0_9BACT|nr:TonB-dependent receptor [Opitutus sp. WL0086]WRQ86896.1 TonB-dependent receptor [Opitutus sp. WL0086]